MTCRIPRPTDPLAAARAEVVELLFLYVEKLRSHFERVVGRHDLTPVQAKVLMALDEPRSMGSVAQEMGCDPSNITGVVDRLAERGLLARTESSHDRRVKLLEATASGRALRDEVSMLLFEDVPGMKKLSHQEMREFRSLLQQAVSENRASPE